jgi:hypothetical protein
VNGHGAQSIKSRRTDKRKSCVQEGSEADRATKCSRTVMSLVSHC